MVEMNIHTIDGEKIGEITLNDNLFNYKINKHVVYQIVKRYLAEKRRGTASTKNRSEVSGGVAFGPEHRDYGYPIPQKMRLVALKSVLSDKIKNNNIIILNNLELKNGKTKEINNLLNNLNIDNNKVLIIIDKEDGLIRRAVRNLEGVMVTTANKINTFELVNYEKIIMTKNALEVIEEVFE